jgi:hypothetical protein
MSEAQMQVLAERTNEECHCWKEKGKGVNVHSLRA